MRTASVIVSGAPEGQNIRDLNVQATVTAGDVLRSLNLEGFLLSVEGSAQKLAAEENVHDLIPADGSLKFRATPIAEVGATWLERLLFLLGTPSAPPVATALPRTVTPLTPQLPSAGRILVPRDTRPLHEARGWRRQGKLLVGAYRTPRGSMAGEISLANRHRPEFFITNPPADLINNKLHQACFRSRGGNKYYVHFGVSSPEIDSGIVAIEQLLALALK